MAPVGVVAVKLTQVVSVAGVFHFSVDKNVPGEQRHLSAHVDSIDDLTDVAVKRLPCAAHTCGQQERIWQIGRTGETLSECDGPGRNVLATVLTRGLNRSPMFLTGSGTVLSKTST